MPTQYEHIVELEAEIERLHDAAERCRHIDFFSSGRDPCYELPVPLRDRRSGRWPRTPLFMRRPIRIHSSLTTATPTNAPALLHIAPASSGCRPGEKCCSSSNIAL